jgi:hypothetical protein
VLWRLEKEVPGYCKGPEEEAAGCWIRSGILLFCLLKAFIIEYSKHSQILRRKINTVGCHVAIIQSEQLPTLSQSYVTSSASPPFFGSAVFLGRI